MWSKYFRPLLRSAQTAEDDGLSLGQRHCRAGWCLEDLSSLCGRSGSSDGSVFVASSSGTCFFSEIIGPAAAGPAGSAPAPLAPPCEWRDQTLHLIWWLSEFWTVNVTNLQTFDLSVSAANSTQELFFFKRNYYHCPPLAVPACVHEQAKLFAQENNRNAVVPFGAEMSVFLAIVYCFAELFAFVNHLLFFLVIFSL